MSALADRYLEIALSYFQAAQKLWKSETLDYPLQPDFLAIPTLNCLALSFEISLKGVLVAKGEAPETFQGKYGHRLSKLWRDEKMTGVRETTVKRSEWWTYPAAWPGEGSNYERFQKHFQWLNDAFAGQSDFKEMLVFRYPEGEQTFFIPPDFMLEAGGTILGIVETEIAKMGSSNF